jgi:hypothetical protein
MIERTAEDRARIDREMLQFIKDIPWSGSVPGPLGVGDYDEGSRRSVYANSRGMKF